MARIEHVSDLEDPRLDPYRDVRDPAWLRERGIFLAEGRLAVRTLLAAPRFRARSILATEPALQSLADVLATEGDAPPVYAVSRETLAGVSGVRFHQGCVAVGERADALSAASLLAALEPGPRLVVLLEAITDPDNVGGLFRNALAFGVDALLLSPRCASPLYRKAIRTSRGASLRVPFATLESWPKELELLRAHGFALLALTPSDDALDLGVFGAARPRPERTALMLGTEGFGLSRGVLESADAKLRIGMVPGADSLNVATASAIAMRHFFELGR